MNPALFFAHNKGLFFGERAAAAAYVREHCPEELEHVLKTAGDVAHRRFLFDLRWDMERTYEPVAFAGEIDWLHQPGDDPEWVFQLNRMRYWVCLGQAYAVTGEERYAETFAAQMCHWVQNVRRENPAHGGAWRTIEAGIRLENWLKAMCYFEGSPAITPAVMETFIGSITEHAEFLMGVWDHFNLLSNWGVLANRGLLLGGVMLPDAPRAEKYILEALRRLEREMGTQVPKDGFHWEQSPLYHNEVLRCYLDVVQLSQRRGIPLPAAVAQGTRRMLYANRAMQKPDGNELLMGDSDEIDQRDIMTLGAALFADGILKGGGYPRLDFDSVWQLGAEAAPAYGRLPAANPPALSAALTDSGNYCFRSGFDEGALFFHFHCGPAASGHGHCDQLHVDLFCRGEDILTDAGRYTYVDKPERYEFKNAAAHNTCTVDGEEFTVCTDSWNCAKICRPVNQKFLDCGKYGYAEGGHLGYSNLGVFVNRRVIYIRPGILLLADEFYAAAPHTYRQYFHFGNTGEVKGENGAYRFTSGKNRAELRQVSALAPLAGALSRAQVSRHYNSAEEATALCTEIAGKGFVSLYTAIALSPAGAPEALEVEKIPVYSRGGERRLADAVVEALNIRMGARFFTAVIAHQEYVSSADTFLADGCTGLGNAVVFDRGAGETVGGTILLR